VKFGAHSRRSLLCLRCADCQNPRSGA
jgi:hypothetical protein